MIAKKWIKTLVLAAVLLLGINEHANAAFSNGDFIRVVYKSDGTGNEFATSLANARSWTTPGGLGGSQVFNSDNFSLSSFAGSNWSNLSVGYFAMSSYNFWLSGAAGGLDNKPGMAAGLRGTLLRGRFLYSRSATANNATVASTDANSFYTGLDKSGLRVGSWAGYVTDGRGVTSLADLATVGYVDQYLYHYPMPASLSRGTGLEIAKIRTFADGHTELIPVSSVARVSSVPLPAAVYLFGSGLFGLIGIRRKNLSETI